MADLSAEIIEAEGVIEVVREIIKQLYIFSLVANLGVTL